MTVSLRLYRFDGVNNLNEDMRKFIENYDISILSPSFVSLHKYGYGWFVNLCWFIVSMGKIEILLVKKENELAHFSYIIPKVFRFPFMKNDDIQVGPCFTCESYRQHGIYTAVLQYIQFLYGEKNKTIWIYTTHTNIPSQKAIMKAGFKFYANTTMSRITKIIQLKK